MVRTHLLSYMIIFARPWPRACQILDLSIFDRFKSTSDICFLYLAQTIVYCLDYVHAREAVREPRAMGIGTCLRKRGDPKMMYFMMGEGEPISWQTLLVAARPQSDPKDRNVHVPNVLVPNVPVPNVPVLNVPVPNVPGPNGHLRQIRMISKL